MADRSNSPVTSLLSSPGYGGYSSPQIPMTHVGRTEVYGEVGGRIGHRDVLYSDVPLCLI